MRAKESFSKLSSKNKGESKLLSTGFTIAKSSELKGDLSVLWAKLSTLGELRERRQATDKYSEGNEDNGREEHARRRSSSKKTESRSENERPTVNSQTNMWLPIWLYVLDGDVIRGGYERGSDLTSRK